MNVVLFWSTYNKDIDTSFNVWRNKTIHVSPFHVLPLYSYTRKNVSVILYTYQNLHIPELPPNVIIADADDWFSAEWAYKSLRLGHSIAHISDLVRLISASNIGDTLILDMDTVMLRRPPDDTCYISSVPAKRTGGFAPKWGKSS